MAKNCSNITIYRLSDRVAGVNDREWHNTKPAGTVANSTTAIGRDFRLCHDFTLPTTTVSVNPNINLNDTNDTAGLLDIQVVDTVITVPAGGVWIQYAGGSEGYWAIEVGQCCGPLELRAELGYTDREDASSIVGPVFLPEGQHLWRGWNIDTGGTNSSHNAQYSLDGVTFSAPIPSGVEFNQEKRIVECQIISACDPIPEGWQVEKFKDCIPVVVDPLPTSSGSTPALSQKTIPVDYVNVTISADADTLTAQNGLVDATSASITNGTGNNAGPGVRYTVNFPIHPKGTNYQWFATPIGIATTNDPNAKIPQEISKTATSVTFAFYTGDDSNSIDDHADTDFYLQITGGECIVFTPEV